MCSPITMSKTMTAALSGQRDSNPQPRPWQGRTLPIVLCPHKNQSQKSVVSPLATWNKNKTFLQVYFMRWLYDFHECTRRTLFQILLPGWGKHSGHFWCVGIPYSRNHLHTLGLIFVFLLFVSNHQYVKELVCVSSTEELTFQIYNFFRKKKKIYVFFSIFFNVLSSSRQPYNQNLSVFSTKTSKIFNFFLFQCTF